MDHWTLAKRGKWPEFLSALKEYSDMKHSELVPVEDLSKPDSETFCLPMHGVVKGLCTLKTVIFIAIYVMKNEEGLVENWRMTRVIFGVTSSPFLATQVLRQVDIDHQQEFSEAAALITSSFYVDDCLTGAANLQEAIKLREYLNQLLGKAKMTLRKWRSNSTELKATIPDNLLEKENVQLISAPAACHKALGVHWDTSLDTLHVATSVFSENDVPTKRQVLLNIARIFDIQGWVSPVTVSLKIVLQCIWQLGIDWDESIPPELAETWITWRKELPVHAIPRCYHAKRSSLCNSMGFVIPHKWH